MINRTKTVQVLRKNLRGMFTTVEQLQDLKSQALYNPQLYIHYDNQIGDMKTEIDTLKELIRFLDGEDKEEPQSNMQMA